MLQCFEVIPYFIYRERFRASLSLLGTAPSVAPWGFFVGHFSKRPACFVTVDAYHSISDLSVQAHELGGVPRIPRFHSSLAGVMFIDGWEHRSVFPGFNRI